MATDHSRIKSHNRPSYFGGMKLRIPSFHGKNDPHTYLDWEKETDFVLNCQQYPEHNRARLVVIGFKDYALSWWDQFATSRRRNGEYPIETWSELKTIMKKRYAPTHYHQKPKTTSKAWPEKQGKHNSGMYSNFSRSKDTICYGGNNERSVAAISRTKKVDESTYFKLSQDKSFKKELLHILEKFNSGLMHLPLSKEVETGTKLNKEHNNQKLNLKAMEKEIKDGQTRLSEQQAKPPQGPTKSLVISDPISSTYDCSNVFVKPSITCKEAVKVSGTKENTMDQETAPMKPMDFLEQHVNDCTIVLLNLEVLQQTFEKRVSSSLR